MSLNYKPQKKQLCEAIGCNEKGIVQNENGINYCQWHYDFNMKQTEVVPIAQPIEMPMSQPIEMPMAQPIEMPMAQQLNPDQELIGLAKEYRSIQNMQNRIELFWIQNEIRKAEIIKAAKSRTNTEEFAEWVEKEIGIKIAYAYNYMRLLDNPDLIKMATEHTGIKLGHVFSLLSAPVEVRRQVEANLNDSQTKNYSVRDIDELKKKHSDELAKAIEEQNLKHRNAIESRKYKQSLLEDEIQELKKKVKDLNDTIKESAQDGSEILSEKYLLENKVKELEQKNELLERKNKTNDAIDADFETITQNHNDHDPIFVENVNEYLQNLCAEVIAGYGEMSKNIDSYARTKIKQKKVSPILTKATKEKMSESIDLLNEMISKLEFIGEN